jgi:co-chaperonin GroES (HSP10)
MAQFELLQEHSFLMEENENQGHTAGGIHVQLGRLQYRNYGVVYQTHPTCKHVLPGDFIVYKKYAPQLLTHTQGKSWVMYESQVLAILREDDGQTWYEIC